MDKKVKQVIKELYERHNFKYDDSKDLYSNYASQLMNLPYEDCLEFKDNKPNILGKERKFLVKLLVLSCLEELQ